MNSYRATARREGQWWAIEVDGVGWTQARRLDEAEHMARDLIAEKRRLIRELKAAHLSARDIGQLAGVSHQRVSQLTSGKAS